MFISKQAFSPVCRQLETRRRKLQNWETENDGHMNYVIAIGIIYGFPQFSEFQPSSLALHKHEPANPENLIFVHQQIKTRSEFTCPDTQDRAQGTPCVPSSVPRVPSHSSPPPSWCLGTWS